MLQKTKLTLLRLFAIVAFVALFVVASISLASCSSGTYVESITKADDGTLYANYSDGTSDPLGTLDDSSTSSEKVIADISYNNGKLTITYDDGSTNDVDISSVSSLGGCDHNYEALPYEFNTGLGNGVLQEQNCGDAGLALEYCTECGDVIVTVKPATGLHTYDYNTITWTWTVTKDANGYVTDYTATASYTCTTCNHDEVITAEVTKTEVDAAQCVYEGIDRYTATAVINGTTVTCDEVKEVATAPTGLHTYVDSSKETHTIVMTDDAPAYVYIDGSTTPATYEDLVDLFGAENLIVSDCSAGASLKSENSALKCTVCGESFHGVTDGFAHDYSVEKIENEKAATCEENGSYEIHYYCSVCGLEDTTAKETVTVPATGHSYNTTAYDATTNPNGYTVTWTALPAGETDVTKITGYTVTFTFTCNNDSTHTEEVDGTVSCVHTEYSCQNDETKEYTATCTFQDMPFSDTHTDTLQTGSVGYHTAVDGTKFYLEDNYIYEVYYTYTYNNGYTYISKSSTPMTVDEFLAIGGVITSYGCDDKISYGYIYCTTCDVTGTNNTKITVSLPEGGHQYTSKSTTSWTWNDDMSATLNITCLTCGKTGQIEASSVTSVDNGDGTITYTATATYGKESWSGTKTISTTTIGTSTTATLSATNDVYTAQAEVTTDGFYAVTFTTNTTSYITVSTDDGDYTYTDYDATNAKAAKAGTSDIKYLCDANGNAAYIYSGTIVYITISLYDASAATSEVTATYTVDTATAITMTAGENFTVSLGGDATNYYTTLTVAATGYYKVTLTEGAYITIYDDYYTYYYYTYSDVPYILDYSIYSSDVALEVEAGTVLNIYLSYYTSDDEVADITLLIALDADYDPAEAAKAAADYVITSTGLTATTLTSDGSWFGTAYTIYVEEAGTYTFTVDASGDISVEDSSGSTSVYDGGSEDFTFAAGDTITVYATKDTTLTVTVKS